MVWFALLAIGFACTGSISAPVQAQDVSPETQLKVRVTGSWGGAVESATVTQRYRATQGSRTQTSGAIPYVHVGQGQYEATANPAKYSAGRYSYALKVSAPDYASKVVSPHSPALIEDREVELVHNNYYARCNQDWDDGWSFGGYSWTDCGVDPDRLIETFGSTDIHFQTESQPYQEEFEEVRVDRPLPRPLVLANTLEGGVSASERGVSSISLSVRRDAYERLIEAIALAPLRTRAQVEGSMLNQAVEQLPDGGEEIDWGEITAVSGEGVAVAGEVVDLGSESVEVLLENTDYIGEAVQLGIKVRQAQSQGKRDAFLRALIYWAELRHGRGSIDWAFRRLAQSAPTTSNGTIDPAYTEALQNVREKIDDQKSMGLEELVDEYQSGRIFEVLGEFSIGFGTGTGAKALAGKALAAKGLAATGAGTAGAGATVATAGAAAVGIAAGAFAVDAYRGISNRHDERSLLAMAPVVDDLLRSYPDGSPRVDLREISCGENTQVQTRFDNQGFVNLRDEIKTTPVPSIDVADFTAEERWGTLMRLQLGILFNETRRSYLLGEERSLLGGMFGELSELFQEEKAAYDQCMAAVSEKKVKRAGALISEIVSAGLESEGDTAQPEGANLSLILDSSGSMTENDPDDLRIDAAKMIVDQLPPAAAVSVVDFDGSAETLVSTSGVSPSRQNTLTASGRPQVKEAIERIDADGNTHIGRALKEGARTLRDNARLQNVALLLTDGKGEYDGEVRAYQENGWCLYTIALGSEPNLQLLRSLADSTCGKYMKATSAIDVSREFGQVLNDIQETPLLATRQGELKPDESARHTVSVDQTVEDLRLQLTWPGSSMELQLTGPQGRPVGTDVAQGQTYAVVRAEDVRPGQYTVEVIAREVDSAGEPYQLMVSGSSSLRPETAQFPTAVRPSRTAPIQVELPAAVVRTQSVQAEATQYANAGGSRKSLSLTRRQRGDTLSFVGQLPPANTEGDRRVVVRITGNTQGGSSFRRVVDRTYTVTPDAEITRPTIKRVIGTQVVLRGARAFGLQPGLTIYVQAPNGRRVGEGIITSTDGSRATVDLQAIMGAKEITPQYAISYDPVQWRADR